MLTFIVEHELATLPEDFGTDDVDLDDVSLGEIGVHLTLVAGADGSVASTFLLDDRVPEAGVEEALQAVGGGDPKVEQSQVHLDQEFTCNYKPNKVWLVISGILNEEFALFMGNSKANIKGVITILGCVIKVFNAI